MGTTVPAARRESVWRTIARMLENFGDALDTTEATLLAERVSKLEKEVTRLKEQRPTSAVSRRSPASFDEPQHSRSS